jgi:hypothetical protein
MTITAQEWKIYYQIEVALKTMGFWQRVLEGEKYVRYVDDCICRIYASIPFWRLTTLLILFLPNFQFSSTCS